jgi:DHA1 family tetracycline resistance protein-like MFS transporter
MLIAVRLVGGAMQANAAVANAYVADITPPEERAAASAAGRDVRHRLHPGAGHGRLLGGINLQLPFFVAGGLALLNLAYGWFVLPESCRPGAGAFDWSRANPLVRCATGALKGVGLLVVVIAWRPGAVHLYTSWVLYTTFKFGWGPAENGWSLFAVGIMSALVQGVLLGTCSSAGRAQRWRWGLMASSATYLALWGWVPEGWMMYVVIFRQPAGRPPRRQRCRAWCPRRQRQRTGPDHGLGGSLNSLMAVIAPVVGAPLLGLVSHFPQGDWRIGRRVLLRRCCRPGLMLAIFHFRRGRRRPLCRRCTRA